MFGMSFGEILIIAVIAILFLGPDKLPDAMVKVAKFFKSFKKSVSEVKETFEHEVKLQELRDDASAYKGKIENAAGEIKKTTDFDFVDEVNKATQDITDSLTSLDKDSKSTEHQKDKGSKDA